MQKRTVCINAKANELYMRHTWSCVLSNLATKRDAKNPRRWRTRIVKLWNAKEVQLIAEANDIASGGTGYFSRHVTATIST
ncbi:probable G-protein coupled receptor 63 isoform X2 [Amblyraja radiata]|uniref:probable G-protein coupled receptor 63 isoform X2 n=1 Tax=Amblyraja radiata TaxID=386614 RepID=UPI001401E4E8|nr:probable G-protein coupled receptor 63 isoform X2 [Amblyraja radiata]